jgi:hypothetical protein
VHSRKPSPLTGHGHAIDAEAARVNGIRAFNHSVATAFSAPEKPHLKNFFWSISAVALVIRQFLGALKAPFALVGSFIIHE